MCYVVTIIYYHLFCELCVISGHGISNYFIFNNFWRNDFRIMYPYQSLQCQPAGPTMHRTASSITQIWGRAHWHACLTLAMEFQRNSKTAGNISRDPFTLNIRMDAAALLPPPNSHVYFQHALNPNLISTLRTIPIHSWRRNSHFNFWHSNRNSKYGSTVLWL